MTKDLKKAKHHMRIAADKGDLEANIQLGRILLQGGDTKAAITRFDKAVVLAIIGKTKQEKANLYRVIVANLLMHSALDESERFIVHLTELEQFLSKEDKLNNAEIYFYAGYGFSRRTNKMKKEPVIRSELLRAQYYLEKALRLFQRTLGGNFHEQVARTLDAMGSADVKRAGVSWQHVPTLRQYNRRAHERLELAYEIYRKILGDDHETTIELRKYINSILFPLTR